MNHATTAEPLTRAERLRARRLARFLQLDATRITLAIASVVAAVLLLFPPWLTTTRGIEWHPLWGDAPVLVSRSEFSSPHPSASIAWSVLALELVALAFVAVACALVARSIKPQKTNPESTSP